MRSIKQLHTAVNTPMDDLVTYTTLPLGRNFERFDPFLVLNHHGLQIFNPGNRGLPFGPHPHRGMETLTFIYQGDLTHRDSTGSDSVIKAGGVQWMTAGRGIIHEEVSSREFKEKGGPLDLVQVWFNLPSSLKMSTPGYTGLQREQIPDVVLDDGKVVLHPVAGDWNGHRGPVHSVSNISIAGVDVKRGGKYKANTPATETVLLYVVTGIVKVNGRDAGIHTLIEFGNDGEGIEIEGVEDAVLIFGHGKPTNEPIMAYGPFVMNTEQEIEQAYADYRSGLFK